jgi:flagellar motor protein MotB
VRDYLATRWNVDAVRLQAEGVGFSQLLDKANPQAPANRRVQAINEGPAG